MVMHLYIRLVSVICTGSSIMEPGSLLNGMLVAKCELGYMVTVDVGREQWKGILYHNPSGSESLNDSDQNHTVICRSQNELWDPARFEENGVGYKYFHAEIWEKLKRFYGNEEDGMNKKIWLIWNRKSEAEKQVWISPSNNFHHHFFFGSILILKMQLHCRWLF